MLLPSQVALLALWAQARSGWRRRMDDGALRGDRGDVYTTTIMVALGVALAVVVGTILFTKFQVKAESIDTETPTGAVP